VDTLRLTPHLSLATQNHRVSRFRLVTSREGSAPDARDILWWSDLVDNGTLVIDRVINCLDGLENRLHM
jgi:hypothetical protein